MATAVVLEHIPGEHAGQLVEWLPAAGVDLEIVRLHAGDPLPKPGAHEAIVVMGGPQDAYGDDRGQPQEVAFIAAALAADVPVLGICLGAQLLALAAGGEVARNPNGPEFGHGLVRRGDAAAADPVFRTVPFFPDVVHWHSDEIRTLPAGAVQLCRGTHTENQAFRVGERAWGLQFHIEVDEEMVRRWALADGVDPQAVLPFPADVDLARTWRPAVDGFARIVRGGFGGALL